MHMLRRPRRRRHRITPTVRLDRALTRPGDNPITMCAPRAEWVRDLTEEGIEPHPGPTRFISKNINGMSAATDQVRIFRKIRIEHNEKPIKAIFLQEHNIKQASSAAAKRAAKSQRLELFIAPIGPFDTKGGTAILIPAESIETRPNESYHAAVARITASFKAAPHSNARACTLVTLIDGHERRLTSAYAHADSAHTERPDFFTTTLARVVDSNTILGIDANCVPDETLDLERTTTAPYTNTGANELCNLVSSHNLIDVAREWLGTERFYSAFQMLCGQSDHVSTSPSNSSMGRRLADDPYRK